MAWFESTQNWKEGFRYGSEVPPAVARLFVKNNTHTHDHGDAHTPSSLREVRGRGFSSSGKKDKKTKKKRQKTKIRRSTRKKPAPMSTEKSTTRKSKSKSKSKLKRAAIFSGPGYGMVQPNPWARQAAEEAAQVEPRSESENTGFQGNVERVAHHDRRIKRRGRIGPQARKRFPQFLHPVMTILKLANSTGHRRGALHQQGQLRICSVNVSTCIPLQKLLVKKKAANAAFPHRRKAFMTSLKRSLASLLIKMENLSH